MLTALPPYRAPNPPDWLGLIPNYHKYLGIKLFLAGIAAAVSIVALVLNKTFTDKISPHRNPHAYLHSDSIAYGAAFLALIWALFELMVVFLFNPRQPPRRGIHPGGHILFLLTIWILALYVVIEDVNYMKARERRRDRLFLNGTPQSVKDEISHIQKAVLGMYVVLLVVELALFGRACYETWLINSWRRAPMNIRMETIATPQQPGCGGPDIVSSRYHVPAGQVQPSAEYHAPPQQPAQAQGVRSEGRPIYR